TSTSPSVFTPAGGIRGIRATYGTEMTGAIPIPSDTIHTNVNARAFASERVAQTKSFQAPLSMSTIESHSTLHCKGKRRANMKTRGHAEIIHRKCASSQHALFGLRQFQSRIEAICGKGLRENRRQTSPRRESRTT